MTKDTWTAGAEVDALLAQLRGDSIGLYAVLTGMSIEDLSNLGQQLYSLQTVIGDVAVAKARGNGPRT